MTQRLSAQIDFLKRADRLKSVNRANALLDQSRPENAAEHSWQLALWALVLEPVAGPDVNIDRVIKMLLLHDLVEIIVGDHPIHLKTDWKALELAEQTAAEELFGMLPTDQATTFLALWQEFEADTTPDAKFAKVLDRSQPMFQVLCAERPNPEHLAVVNDNLKQGRAAYLQQAFPDAYNLAQALLNGGKLETSELSLRLGFLSETDQLKSVQRASRLLYDDRFENSAEHSWHIMLFAWVLSEYAAPSVSVNRALRMLLLHDIVEIDAGDHPIHGQVDHAAQAAEELAAAQRLFGMLPEVQNQEFMSIWQEFEQAESPDACFAKAIDRFQTPVGNLETGGGSWIDYNVTYEQIHSRVGTVIIPGAPALWAWLDPLLRGYFSETAEG
ncbi:HD domain-containing protein [Ruegeria faecimaris]|uniref:5'-deoxynucleotidase n=1 Tax=Ruegeria faecimaris TaxID=686389 RepID=A0A521B339_9RHOB|nr:HD domain-containing protein [Ruegeria faecimaris]SMO41517.1 putative hydrolases of HD superfamily [Ruegeria faecimaris]